MAFCKILTCQTSGWFSIVCKTNSEQLLTNNFLKENHTNFKQKTRDSMPSRVSAITSNKND